MVPGWTRSRRWDPPRSSRSATSPTAQVRRSDYGLGLKYPPPQRVCLHRICDSPGPRRYEKKLFEFDPEHIGIPRCAIEDLKGGQPPYPHPNSNP